MSVQNEILRIQTAKNNLKTSIQNKDVTVPSSTKIDGYPALVDSIGGASDVADAVRFFDYDGTILYQYSAAQFLALTEMPANPSHTGLVAQGWNWSLADAQEYVAEWGYQDIGQTYVTASGDTEIDIDFPTGFKRLSPYLRIAVNGTVEVDWGDNSSVETITGSSLTTNIDKQHTYAATGNYTIIIHVVSGSFSFYTSSSAYPLLHNNQNSTEKNRIYASRVNAIRIGNNCNLGSYCFCSLIRLRTITIPQSISGIGSSGFQYCYSLKCCVIPNNNATSYSFSSTLSANYNLLAICMPKNLTGFSPSVGSNYNLDRLLYPPNINLSSNLSSYPFELSRTIVIPYRKYKYVFKSYNYDDSLEGKTTVPQYGFYNNLMLKNIVIPDEITEIKSTAFSYCLFLKSVVLPNNIYIQSSAFSSCQTLKNINIPANATISNAVFNSCSALSNLYFSDTVTVSNSNICSSNNSLKSVRFPNNFVGNNTIYFSSCYSLEDIEIPSGNTQIIGNAFSSCYSLPTITIPSGITTIGNNA